MRTPRTEAALAHATEAAARGPHSTPADGHPRSRHLAIGDPQADITRYPEVPNVELVARDFGTFREVQRDQVAHLLRAGRFRVAHAAAEDLLVLHAGVTREDLHAVGLPEARGSHAPTVADALNRALDGAVVAWKEGPLSIPGLYQPGSAAQGEGRGIFYQRPSLLPEDAAHRAATPRRRFDPHRLPTGLTQVVGHTRDKRSRELLALPHEEARDGVLRYLVTDGATVHYRPGPPPPASPREALLVFTDGGMRESPLESFELLDLDTRAPARPLGEGDPGGQP